MTTPVVNWGAGAQEQPNGRGIGCRVRLTKLRGQTAPSVLRAPLYFPALLGEVTIPEEFAHNDFETQQGDFSTPAPNADGTTQKAREFDLQTLRLDDDPPWLVEFGLNHEHFVSELENIGRWRTPFQMLVVTQFGEVPEVNADFTLRRLEKTLKPGETDTRYLTLTVHEWRSGERTDGSTWVNGRLLPTTAKLKAGDTFKSLAKTYYGSTKDWRIIRNANGFKRMGGTTPIVSAPHWSVGDTIQIPNPLLDTSTTAGVGARDGGV